MIERIMWEEFATALDKLEADGEAFDVLCSGRALIRLGAPGLLPGPNDEQRAKAETKKAAAAKHAQAKSSGYTGEVCKNCGSFRMKRGGTCAVCEDCGESGGCS